MKERQKTDSLVSFYIKTKAAKRSNPLAALVL